MSIFGSLFGGSQSPATGLQIPQEPSLAQSLMMQAQQSALQQQLSGAGVSALQAQSTGQHQIGFGNTSFMASQQNGTMGYNSASPPPNTCDHVGELTIEGHMQLGYVYCNKCNENISMGDLIGNGYKIFVEKIGVEESQEPEEVFEKLERYEILDL